MATSGKLMAGGIVAFGAIFGIGMWYSQVYAYYEEVTGLSEVTVGGEPFAVSGYTGISAQTSPLKMRGCFTFEDPKAAITAGKLADDAVPLKPPYWFDCFDPEQILTDIESGAATPIMAGLDEGDGADLYMAIYPDGRAYRWRQPNAKYKGRH